MAFMSFWRFSSNLNSIYFLISSIKNCFSMSLYLGTICKFLADRISSLCRLCSSSFYNRCRIMAFFSSFASCSFSWLYTLFLSTCSISLIYLFIYCSLRMLIAISFSSFNFCRLLFVSCNLISSAYRMFLSLFSSALSSSRVLRVYGNVLLSGLDLANDFRDYPNSAIFLLSISFFLFMVDEIRRSLLPIGDERLDSGLKGCSISAISLRSRASVLPRESWSDCGDLEDVRL